ncbi:MAG: hypothetical protein GF383_08965 [Candidatus Lokiarchaeota archaeon]|nr:hypothetical protein [Candidatus Lokiarchaeota archaeon]MBD3340565.1 hypothetical protein [Candidatus Lokiarchaeota archaeon]
MHSSKKIKLSINSVNDIVRCVNLASLLEISGWPKPGNIHRTRNFIGTCFEHLLAGIAAIVPNYMEFCHRIHRECSNDYSNYSFIKLGKFFKETTKMMMKFQKGGNVLLGHILLLTPLAATASICLHKKKKSLMDFKSELKKVIDESSVEDTLNLYDAIRICNPGGLGSVKKYDVNNKESINEIKRNNINLKKIFNLSKEYDTISKEYSSYFDITLKQGLPYYFQVFADTMDINIATVNTFIYILSKHPDTLISRKTNRDKARMVSEKALKIIREGGIKNQKGIEMTKKFDNYLHRNDNLLNPGTTADLIAGVIFCALLFGLRF